jgi:NhaP-type Na+/H+ or K+/H+ antiporter
LSPAALTDPGLTLALALAAGMLAQSLARHLRLPGIIVLLAAGVALGPDAAGVIQPRLLGSTLHMVIGFSVAVILFEGGMNLNLARLRREARSIRQFVTLGSLTTAAGGTLAARLLLGWDWTPSILFGTLVIVTGPTVITPLLRRLKVQRRVATVLEAEGVLTDAIGAVVAVVALEVAIRPSGDSLVRGMLALLARLGFGLVAGLAGGLLVAVLLRAGKLVPEGLENVFTLSFAVAIFQASNAAQRESGILAVVVAGVVVGNIRSSALRDLKEFKEQLTVMLIGVLFILLAADTRLADVRELGWPGVWVVLALLLVVRPINVLVGTAGSDLSVREKTFLSTMAPRGIVAAAVSSLFAQTLEQEGLPGGAQLQALVFLVIAVTVIFAGLVGGPVGRLLRVRRPTETGYVLLGANDLGRALGRALRDGGEEVVLIDSNPHAIAAAEADGLRALYGSALSEAVLQRAEIDTRAGCAAVTSNDEVNLLFARKARKEYRVPRVWVTLRRQQVSVSEKMVHDIGARILFGGPRSVDFWTIGLERQTVELETWTRGAPEEIRLADFGPAYEELGSVMLPLAVRRGGEVRLLDEETSFRAGDVLQVAVFRDRRREARQWLESHGWETAA